MSRLSRFILLFSVTLLLVYLSYRSTIYAKAYLSTSQEISTRTNTHESIQKKIDKILEELSAGLYSKYSQNREYLEALTLKAESYQQKSVEFFYYFLMTLALFIAVFLLLDVELLLIFIGMSAVVALATALVAPLLMMTVYSNFPLIGEVTLSYESKSIYTTITKLYHQSNYLVGTMVLLFSVVIPFTKALFIMMYGFLKERGIAKHLVSLLEKIGKWSMADVFIVAVLVVFFSTQQDIHTSLKIEIGLYFFIVYVLLSMLGSLLLSKSTKV